MPSATEQSFDAWTIWAIPSAAGGKGIPAQYAGIDWFHGLWLVFGIAADGHAGIWVSPDGVSWRLATSPQQPSGHGYRVVDVTEGVVDGCPRLVAVGQLATPLDGFWGSIGPSFALVSDDGLTWSLSPSVPATATEITGVAAAQHGFVAMGTRSSWPAESGERQDARVWRSTDGQTWTETAPPELAQTIPLGIATLNGILVATGFADRPSPPQMAWLSMDGLAWDSHEALPPQSQGSIFERADARDGLIVMVGLGEKGPYASESSDGVTWTTEFLSDTFAEPSGLDVRNGAVVVVGYAYCGDCQSTNFIWAREAGGTTWRSVTLRDHVPDEVENQLAAVGLLDVATSGSQTAILTGDGRVLLTGGSLP